MQYKTWRGRRCSWVWNGISWPGHRAMLISTKLMTSWRWRWARVRISLEF